MTPTTDNPQGKHTKITDAILEVIDTGETNRYAVALRLTAWHQKQQEALLQRLLKKASKTDMVLRNGRWVPYLMVPVEVLEAELERKTLN